MVTGYDGVKRFVRNNRNPDWVLIIKACLLLARQDGSFAGKWALAKATEMKKERVWSPGLHSLTTSEYQILKFVASTANSRGAYYYMPDMEGVERALQELGQLGGE